MSSTTLIYDGTFPGFLSLVFEIYERGVANVKILKPGEDASLLFENIISVSTNAEHADRVWKGFKKKVSARSSEKFYAAFLSEQKGIEQTLLEMMRYVFANGMAVDSNLGNKHVLEVAQVAKMVGREKHRMEAFVRFQLITDGIYYAAIEPDFNVLPLIEKHFTSRYADQQWVIYDLRRKYGLHYDLQKTRAVEIDFTGKSTRLDPSVLDEKELLYEQLWKTYFKSVNIVARNNKQLHLRHVPLRYWKHLTEKV